MIYFDSAATTLQKPAAVAKAVAEAVRTVTTPGRGDYPAARRAADIMLSCRTEAAELFHTEGPESVVMTCNATHALNIAIKSLVSPGDTVVISGYEHNAVTRPLTAIGGVKVRVVNGRLFDPAQMVEGFSRALDKDVKAAVCTHVSNVFGCALPIGDIAALCRRRGIALIVDASQSAGILPVDVEGWGAAYVAMPGHKGLYGPQGTGILLCDHEVIPLLEGGTGSLSARQEMPDFLPDRLEAGTQNVTGIAGLLEGLRFIQRKGPEVILNHERFLAARCADALSALPGVRVFAAPRLFCQAGVLSFQVDGMDCEDVGQALGEQGIAVRSGLHCAPLAHRSAGTLDVGTVRVSFSAFNSSGDVDALAGAVARLPRRQ